MHNLLFQLHAADDKHLSRLDPSLLSQQALMEMVVDGFEDKSAYQDEHGNYTDYSTWEGVECDEDGEIKAFNFNFFARRYVSPRERKIPLPLQFLPQTLINVKFFALNFTGSLSTRDLFAGLQKLEILKCGLAGTVDFAHFPRTLERLSLDENRFCGNLDMQSLPDSMSHFSASFNQFSGPVCFANLPTSLEILNLRSNQLCGEIRLPELPIGLKIIHLSYNFFAGEVHIEPDTLNLKELDLLKNKICGSLQCFAVSKDQMPI